MLLFLKSFPTITLVKNVCYENRGSFVKINSFFSALWYLIISCSFTLKGMEFSVQYLGCQQPIDKMCAACLVGDRKDVQKLLLENVNPNGFNTVGMKIKVTFPYKHSITGFAFYESQYPVGTFTPLMCAVIANRVETLTSLLENKTIAVDLNQKNNKGKTALHLAAAKGNKNNRSIFKKWFDGVDLQKCAQLLLEHKARTDIQDNKRKTPLDCSSAENKALLDKYIADAEQK
jgi:hypothetical protein